MQPVMRRPATKVDGCILLRVNWKPLTVGLPTRSAPRSRVLVLAACGGLP